MVSLVELCVICGLQRKLYAMAHSHIRTHTHSRAHIYASYTIQFTYDKTYSCHTERITERLKYTVGSVAQNAVVSGTSVFVVGDVSKLGERQPGEKIQVSQKLFRKVTATISVCSWIQLNINTFHVCLLDSCLQLPMSYQCDMTKCDVDVVLFGLCV